MRSLSPGTYAGHNSPQTRISLHPSIGKSSHHSTHYYRAQNRNRIPERVWTFHFQHSQDTLTSPVSTMPFPHFASVLVIFGWFIRQRSMPLENPFVRYCRLHSDQIVCGTYLIWEFLVRIDWLNFKYPDEAAMMHALVLLVHLQTLGSESSCSIPKLCPISWAIVEATATALSAWS